MDMTRDALQYVVGLKTAEVLDINGWNLHKTLHLLYKSTPTIFEWCASLIVYRTSPEFEKLKDFYHTISQVRKTYITIGTWRRILMTII